MSTSTRRYKTGDYPVYDEAYTDLRNKSPILNSAVRSQSMTEAGALQSKSHAQYQRLRITGEDKQDGYYFDNYYDSWKMGLLPAAELHLHQLLQRFETWAQRQVAEGKALQKPEQMPEEMQEERLRLEAQIDVHQAELKAIDDKIKQFEEAEKKARPDMLQSGPAGRIDNLEQEAIDAMAKHGRKPYADGQRVSFKGIVPFIDEPDSPYNRMPIATYRQMSNIWRNQWKREVEDQYEKDEIHGGYKHKESDKRVTGMQLASMKKPGGSGRQKVPREHWPEWPEGAKTVDELHEEKKERAKKSKQKQEVAE